MRYAVVSDIHANLPAWNAVLEDIASLNIDHIINLGDIVGYGPSPSEVIASVKKHAAASVIGNHDAVCADRLDPSIFNENARAVIEWTKAQLNEADSQFLVEMHDMIRPEGAGFLITHAEVAAPFDFGYILKPEDAAKNFSACEDSLIFIGHTHFAGVFMEGESGEVTTHKPVKFECEPGKRYIINPGSVGDPRTADIVASYCIFDSQTAKVEFRKVNFDIELYRQLLSASDLTSKPYFLRYLDSASSGGKQMKFPTVEDSEVAPPKALATRNINHSPAINFSGSIATSHAAKKEKSALKPVILLLSFALLIGASAISWLYLRKTDTQETTDKTAPEEPAKITVPVIARKLPVTGRYVKISKPDGPYLSLAEVEVISDGKNISQSKKATQSSDFMPATHAGKAVNGNHDGNTTDHITHTADENPWWEVDLGADSTIQLITIWNRNEGSELMKRLNGFTLQIFNEKRQLIYQTDKNPGDFRLIQIK